ncbi:UNVERIFIED_CONTAM: hypothetical protein Slati_0034700 [Sesamum latifolium]|uniref:Reverse transcriptase zinc-binding domain-containing protein n=1 Tax=Sesamum latifolium TaxID=2727402 RepID=A0AAW2Y6L9_9LAMI
MPDLLIWHYSNTGLFTVRSAYHLALSLAAPARTSKERWSRRTWQQIWQAHVPNKAKIFLWRAIRNILPTAMKLQKRLPFGTFCCPFCELEAEQPIHTLLKCPFARQVWALSCIRWSTLDENVMSVEDWVQTLVLKLSPSDFELAMMLCWTIWWSRNLKLANKAFLLPLQVVDFARSYLAAFHSQGVGKSNLGIPLHVSWTPPPTECIKVNFDGAILDSGLALGIGVVARNDAGRCLAWASLKLDRGGVAEMAEAYAAREAVRLAIRHHWRWVIFEGDCESLLLKLSSAQQDCSLVSPLVYDTCFLSLQVVCFVFSCSSSWKFSG